MCSRPAAVRLGQLTALQRLYLVDDSDLPCPLDEASILPPRCEILPPHISSLRAGLCRVS